MAADLNTITKEQLNAAVHLLKIVADTIRELKQVPNGILYAQLMPYMGFDVYSAVINKLRSMKLVEERNNLLIWIGDE